MYGAADCKMKSEKKIWILTGDLTGKPLADFKALYLSMLEKLDQSPAQLNLMTIRNRHLLHFIPPPPWPSPIDGEGK